LKVLLESKTYTSHAIMAGCKEDNI